jgi:hypothetical protein
MTRAFDFVVVGVIYIVAIVIHLMGINLFAPGTPLYSLATTGTAVMHGQERADMWYEILTLWVPLLAAGGISAWAFIREYRRQAATAVPGQF